MSEEMNLYKRCKNIFKFHGVDMGGGGESAPEVENAIETHGLGWTDTEEKAGFDIQWDGNTEGLEYVSAYAAFLAKVSSDLSLIDTIDDLIGATILGDFGEGPIDMTITEDNITTEDNKVFNIEGAVIIAFEDGSIGDLNLSKGIWFMKIDSSKFTNRFYKEATTEEVVHQIDQKYIPGGSGGAGTVFVNLYMDPVSEVDPIVSDKTLLDLQSLINSGATIIAKLSLGDSQTIFWPLIQYYEADGVPGEAYFGYTIYNSTTDSSRPVLFARLNEDGDTVWTCTMFN